MRASSRRGSSKWPQSISNRQREDLCYDGGPAGRFVLAPHSITRPNLLREHISALSRAPSTMEVFWIGADGSIQDRYYYDGFGWNGFTLASAGSALALGSPSGALTAVSRVSNTMEVEVDWTAYCLLHAYCFAG